MKQDGTTTKKDNVNEYDNEDNGNETTIKMTATKTMMIRNNCKQNKNS